MFRKVGVLSFNAARPNPASRLRTILRKWRTLDVTLIGNRDQHFIIRDHILVAEFLRRKFYFSPALVSIAFLDLSKLSFDDLVLTELVGKYVFQISDQ